MFFALLIVRGFSVSVFILSPEFSSTGLGSKHVPRGYSNSLFGANPLFCLRARVVNSTFLFRVFIQASKGLGTVGENTPICCGGLRNSRVRVHLSKIKETAPFLWSISTRRTTTFLLRFMGVPNASMPFAAFTDDCPQFSGAIFRFSVFQFLVCICVFPPVLANTVFFYVYVRYYMSFCLLFLPSRFLSSAPK